MRKSRLHITLRKENITEDTHHFKCEWCNELKSSNELFDYCGYESYIGPICKRCVKGIQTQSDRE